MVSSASHPCLDMGDCNASGSAALPAMQPLGPMAAGDYDAELDIDDFFDAAFPAVLAPAPRRAGAVADALDAEIEEALADASPDAAALCRGGADAQGAAAASGGRAHGPKAAALCRGGADAQDSALDAESEEELAEASRDAAALCRGGVDAPGAAATSGGRADGPAGAALRRRGADAPGGKSPPSPPASPLQEPPSPDLSGRSTVPVAVYTH